MNPSYDDITSRIAEPPSWWQEGGVPRWGGFTPDHASSIYAGEAVLMEIACQSCGTVFHVSMCDDGMSGRGRIEDAIVDGSLHYGDPPNTGCCASGATMNSEPRRILEYWSRNDQRHVTGGTVRDMEAYFRWTRDPLLEGEYHGWAGRTRPSGAVAPGGDECENDGHRETWVNAREHFP